MNEKLSPGQLRYQMARRGLDGAQLARLAGVSAMTISRAATGHRVSTTTLTRIAVALTRTPELRGAELLLEAPEKNKNAARGTGILGGGVEVNDRGTTIGATTS